MKNQIQAIVCDVDGVLIKVVDDIGNFLWHKNIEADLGFSQDQLQGFFVKYWKCISTGTIDTLEAIGLYLESINSRVSSQQFIQYWHQNDSNVDELMIDAMRILKSKGYRLFLGTNQEKYRANHLWDTLGFSDCFEDIFASCYIGYEKPAYDYFVAVHRKMGIQPHEILFIDDSNKNVESAKSCGWQGYCHQSFKQTKKDIFDYL